MPDRWVVVSLDGFATAALGAYGSPWNETPATDRLAAFGTLWDRAIAGSDDPVEVLQELWSQAVGERSWLQAWRQFGRCELILHAGPEASRIAALADQSAFDECTLVDAIPETLDGVLPAEEIEATALGQLMVPVLERLTASDADAACDWSLLWVHTDYLVRCWDAPRWLFPVEEPDEDEVEPPEDQVEWSLDDFEQQFATPEPTPEQPPPVFESVQVPSLAIPVDAHPDLVTSWMQTYGCQVRLLDHLVALLTAAIETRGEPIGLALMGTSGFSLGQNGWIGHRVGPIHSPQIQLPVILYDDQGVGVRISGPRPAGDPLRWVLPQAILGGSARVAADVWADDTRDQDVRIITRSDRAERVVTTNHWFYARQGAAARLYLKPDDRDDYNDIASRCRDVVESMESDLDSNTTGEV